MAASSIEDTRWGKDLEEFYTINLAPTVDIPDVLMEGDEADQPIPPQQHQVESPNTYEMTATSNGSSYPTSTASLPAGRMENDEDTCDVADLDTDTASPGQPIPPQQQQTHQQIETTMGQPRRGAFPGSLNFHVSIDDNKYISTTKRFYTRMMKKFAVKMTWNWFQTNHPLFVRATMLFSEEKDSKEKVQCCTQHSKDTEEMGKHFLRSACSDVRGVSYCSDVEQPGSQLSVAVLFPAQPDPGQTYFSHPYQFQCLSTCASGVNRRPIQILFTLEMDGMVLDRQTVGVTVHTSPGRPYDKAMEKLGIEGVEGCSTKRRRKAVEPLDKAKIVKREAAVPELPPPDRSAADPDAGIYTLPPIPISGARVYKGILDLVKMKLRAELYEASDEIKELYLCGIRDCETAEREQILKEEAPFNN